jgi:hypothetical protein
MADARLKLLRPVSEDDHFKDCEIIDLDARHFYLRMPNDGCGQYFDIVLPREDCPPMIAENLKVGSKVDGFVNCIRIADDGVPGVFLRHADFSNLKKKKEGEIDTTTTSVSLSGSFLQSP